MQRRQNMPEGRKQTHGELEMLQRSIHVPPADTQLLSLYPPPSPLPQLPQTVQVFSFEDGKASGSAPLPAVLTAPVRSDVVGNVYKSMAKNKRQPYAVSREAGHQTSGT